MMEYAALFLAWLAISVVAALIVGRFIKLQDEE